MKKKVIRTTLWLITIGIVLAVWKFLTYQIDMYYSTTVVPNQFDDDSNSAYYALKLQSTVNNIVTIIFLIIIVFICYRIYKTLAKPLPVAKQS